MRKLPKGWSQKTVDELFDVQLGKMLNEIAKAGASQFPYLTNTNVQWARFRLDALNQMHFSPKEREKFSLKTGDLVVCEGGEVGRCAIWKNEISPCYFQKALHRLRPKEPTKIISEYMLAYMRFIAGTKLLGDLTSQSSIAHLTREKFLELAVNLPPLPEQQKIAAILGTWDEALEKLDALIAAKARRKQALMQQLLTGHRRLPGFSKPWKQTRFGDLMKSEDRYADFDDDHLYHLVSARRRAEGVFFREALHGRDIKTKVMKQVRSGDFVISRMQVVHGGLGVVPPQCDGYYASDSYEVLVPRDPAKLSPRFIGHLCRTRRFWHHALVCSHGVHIEKMTFVMADFEHEKFMIPEFAEQLAIAEVLDTADAELRLLRQQRTALDHQKRGLMQQLLTGRTRVAT
jgi:type I restriction enzyme S subunit